MNLALRALIVFTTAAVPAIVMGPAAVAVGLVGALLLYPFVEDRPANLQRFRASVMTPLGLLTLVTLLAWVPCIAASIAPERSFEAVFRTFVYVGVATLLWSALRSDDDDRALRHLTAYATLATAFSLIALLAVPQILAVVRRARWEHVDAALWLKQSASSALLMVPVLLLAGRRNGGAWKAVSLATALGLMVVIWRTDSRSAVAGLLGMIVVWSVLTSVRRRQVKWAISVAVLAIVAIAAAMVWLYFTRDHIRSFGIHMFVPRWLIDPHRQEIWRFAWKLGEGHRWIGVGANTIDRVADASGVRHIPGTNIDRLPSHPHNWLIEIAVETGLVGLIPLLAAVATATWQLLRDYLKAGDEAVLAALLVWTGYCSAGMFNFSFWSSWWQCSFVVLLGICLAARHDAARTTSSPG